MPQTELKTPENPEQKTSAIVASESKRQSDVIPNRSSETKKRRRPQAAREL